MEKWAPHKHGYDFFGVKLETILTFSELGLALPIMERSL